MKATNSKDGKRRFDLAIKVRMDAEEAATLLTAYDTDIENETPEAFVARKLKLSQRKLVDEIRTTILNRGTEAPWYALVEYRHEFDATPHRDALTAALRTKWGL